MNHNSPFISVIITCYNRKDYIQEAINSVLISDYDNYELIIVDDASTDGSAQLILEYAAVDKRIKIFINERNLGQFENRNFAASLASGKYLKYLDSDDTIYPYTLSIMADVAKAYPNAALLASSNILHDTQPYPLYILPSDAYKQFFLGEGFPNVGPSATLISQDAFKSVGGFPKPYYVGTDTILLLLLAAKYPLVKLPPSLIWYRRHEGQALQQGLLNNEYLLTEFPVYLDLLKEEICPLAYRDIVAIRKLLIKRQLKLVLKNLFNFNFKNAVILLQQLQNVDK